ncbi:ABCA1 transporter, partial [Trypanosoma conorhini]
MDFSPMEDVGGFGYYNPLQGPWVGAGDCEMSDERDGENQQDSGNQAPLRRGRKNRVSSDERRAIQQRRVNLMHEEEKGPQQDFAAYEVRESFFLDQLLAVTERLFRQCLRMRAPILLELVVPPIFVCITIILWSLWGTDHFSATNFVDYNQLQSVISTNYYVTYSCSRTPGGVPGLPVCDPVRLVDCEGDESTLPVKGLCVYSWVGVPELLGSFLNGFTGRVAQVPSLDGIIFFQWLARKHSTTSAAEIGGLPNTRFSAILASGMLYFVGDLQVLGGLTAELARTSGYFHYVNGGSYATMAEANVQAKTNQFNWGIVHIRRFDVDALDAIIYLNNTAVPDFDEIVADAYPGGYQFNRAEMYAISGYLTLQKLISEYYINQLFPNLGLRTTAYIASQPFVDYHQSPLLMYTRDIMPLIFVLAFLFSVASRTRAIVLEKEMRIHEAMLIMGVKDSVLYTTWFVRFIAVDFTVCLFITVLLKCTYVTQSDPFIIFLVFFLFTLTNIPLAGLIAAFFSRARLAALLSPIIYFVMTLPTVAAPKTNAALTTIFALLSPSALATILQQILAAEATRGFSAKSMQSSLYEPKTIVVFCIMIADFFLYCLIMFYLDAVMPKDWGTTKHPLFFILDPIRWLRGKKGGNCEAGGPDGRAVDGIFENDGVKEDGAVRLLGLRKVYRRGGKQFVAVNNLYWSLCEGEISVLLGHNGAGKTTTLNMMTGMVKPDGGDCYVYGFSVRHQLSRVRQEIGFCPQHNILWPELTCREHLEFFAQIKGLKGAELEEAVQRMLNETDLQEKVDFPASRLSGGQKRKLSVAVAFVGRSRLVFLDEPTAGMDVGARRYTWELLKRMSSSHTVLLTTHYMDEADLLGHRIGILSNGSLQCSGSSLFLKSRLG